ncbi:hypothetical protein COP2_034890 [Malus domestica]
MDPDGTDPLSFHCQEREAGIEPLQTRTANAEPMFQHLNAPTWVTSLRYQARRLFILVLDRWLPRPNTFKVLSVAPVSQKHMRVQDLLDPVSKSLSLEVLSALFLEEEVNLIRTMPTSICMPADCFMSEDSSRLKVVIMLLGSLCNPSKY